MANRLSMAEIEAILTLHKIRHSNREISHLLEVDRGTVGKYVALAEFQNQPNAPTGKIVCRGTITNRFFQELQGKRTKKRPRTATSRACGFILPPWPDYPLLGCSSAEPNSVSSGNVKLIQKCRFENRWNLKTSQTRPPAPRANKT